ncbi:hypothetical protein DPMN_055521 [Dreissena polymorpha]|uniref:Uncharacterized protein n=1 Tax=Dreissena polymorpha TaxID=45954 RepID=A0A9D4HSN5_DREPO|nr:hypothetical protein DPMN_055521 [Dreissena polymorpha]
MLTAFGPCRPLQVPISMKEARLPMGLRKDLHFKASSEIPEVQERWKDPNQGKRG